MAEPGPVVAAVRRRLPAARELTVVMLMGIAGSQVLDENWSARKVFDHHNAPPVAAAVSYLGLFQGWSMFAPEAPMTDFNLTVDAVTIDGRHVDPYNEVANPKYPNPGFTIPVSLGPSWLFYGYGNHIPNRGRVPPGVARVDPPLPPAHGTAEGSDHVVRGVEGRRRQPAAGRAEAPQPALERDDQVSVSGGRRVRSRSG